MKIPKATIKHVRLCGAYNPPLEGTARRAHVASRPTCWSRLCQLSHRCDRGLSITGHSVCTGVEEGWLKERWWSCWWSRITQTRPKLVNSNNKSEFEIFLFALMPCTDVFVNRGLVTPALLKKPPEGRHKATE